MKRVLQTIITRQREAQARNALNMWTVYDHPKDHPDCFVARRFEVLASSEPVATDDVIQGNLSAIREAFVRCGLTCLTRNDGDQPQIVETWL